MEQRNCEIEDATFENPVERICASEIRNKIENLKNGKVADVDGIFLEVLKIVGK